MNPKPRAGDIWRWYYSIKTMESRVVLLLEEIPNKWEWKDGQTFSALDLGDREVEEWEFCTDNMEDWEFLA